MSLPRWLDPLLDAEQMRETDSWAIETRGIPSLDLMERAGEGLADVVTRHAPAGRVAVVCGKGNNGGDGLVAARLLRQAGRQVDVLLVWPGEWLQGDAKTMLERLPGDKPSEFDATHLKGANVIVDAVLGTGFEGAPRKPVDKVIAAINAAKARVVAADVPSGVNASNGEVEGDAVFAMATATFHRGKPGLWIAPGKAHSGIVEVVDIGIPRGAPAKAEAGVINGGVLREMPRRGSESTKFSSGNVFILGGASGLTGAPSMAALAAMRAGAGYVTVGAPAGLELSFTVRLLEAMMVGLPETDGALSPEAVGPALKAIGRADAVVLGPGNVEGQGRARVRAGDVRARRRAARDRRGRTQRARRRLPGGPPVATVADRADPARGRARPPARGQVRGDRRAPARDGPRGGGEGQGVRGPQGRRHAGRLAQRPRGDLARRSTGARHRRHRRRARGRDRSDARQGPPTRPRGLRRRLRARPRGPDRRGPHGADGVIASDVIQALPAALSA